MQGLSVVIICRNGANVIGETIKSFSGLTDDILIYDNGSTDGTQEIVKRTEARLLEGEWKGFGKTKNIANALAKYDWILSLDADESIDAALKKNLLALELNDKKNVYQFRFKNFLGDKWLQFGEWGNDKHIRLFNKKEITWNDAEVHETLQLPKDVQVITVPGAVLHKTANGIEEYKNKLKGYAALNAEKYFNQGKSSGSVKMFSSAVFSFIKNYFFKLGFLDGATGYKCAKVNAEYTFLKYKKLKEFSEQWAINGSQSTKSS